MTRLLPLIVALSLPMGVVQAQAQPADDSAAQGGGGFLEAPQITPSPVTGDPAEPDITIREGQDQTVYEYRVKGVLYMVKVQPRKGPPYYLYDTDGDGVIDSSDRSPRNNAVQQWLLFSWD